MHRKSSYTPRMMLFKSVVWFAVVIILFLTIVARWCEHQQQQTSTSPWVIPAMTMLIVLVASSYLSFSSCYNHFSENHSNPQLIMRSAKRVYVFATISFLWMLYWFGFHVMPDAAEILLLHRSMIFVMLSYSVPTALLVSVFPILEHIAVNFQWG